MNKRVKVRPAYVKPRVVSETQEVQKNGFIKCVSFCGSNA